MKFGAVGRRVIPVPLGLAVKMSGPFCALNELEEKTILVPSGDQVGLVPPLPCPVVSAPGVRLVWPLPSAFIT